MLRQLPTKLRRQAGSTWTARAARRTVKPIAKALEPVDSGQTVVAHSMTVDVCGAQYPRGSVHHSELAGRPAEAQLHAVPGQLVQRGPR